jgi:hypothetical protein
MQEEDDKCRARGFLLVLALCHSVLTKKMFHLKEFKLESGKTINFIHKETVDFFLFFYVLKRRPKKKISNSK